MSFQLVPKSVTMNDLERRNGHYIVLFHRIRKICSSRVDVYMAEFMHEYIVFCSACRELSLRRHRCRRKESSRSRSLSQLLMSFLLVQARYFVLKVTYRYQHIIILALTELLFIVALQMVSDA